MNDIPRVNDVARLTRLLEDAYDRLAALQAEQDTVGGMTVVVYALVAAMSFVLGFALRGFVGW